MENNTYYDDNEALAEEVDQNLEKLDTSSEDVLEEEDSPELPVNAEENNEANEVNTEVVSLKKVTSDKSIKQPREKIIFNIAGANYDVIRIVGKKDMKWTLTEKPGDGWDICWMDKTVPVEFLAKMLPYQKVNHFPGILSIARKNTLGKNLMKMKKLFPANYKFFPKTYLLPSDYQDFSRQFAKGDGSKTFIIKPEAGSQGKGIFLTKTLDSVGKQDRCVAQEYLKDPYLIDGLKFDMRLYVLIAGCDPLRIFLHKQGLGRFATESYVVPTDENMENVCMHLTNYALNKDSPNFVFNESSDKDDVGHKKSLGAVFKILQEQGHNTKKLWVEIKKLIIKTFCSVQSILTNNYRSCHPNEPYNNMCFEVLGFDVMLDSKLKPWLIEVNHLPSFTTDTPLDKSIKRKVVGDALRLMNVSSKARIEYKIRRKNELYQRTMTPKKVKLTEEERQALFENAQKERDVWEAVNHGEFERIYPLTEEEKVSGKFENYEEFIQGAKQEYQAWTGTEVRRDTQKKNTKKLEASQDLSLEQENQGAKVWNGNTKVNTVSSPTTNVQTSPSQTFGSPRVIPRSPSRIPTTIPSRHNDLNSSSAAAQKTTAPTKVEKRGGHLAPWGPWEENQVEYSDGDSFDASPLNRCKNADRGADLHDVAVPRLTKKEKLLKDYENHLKYATAERVKPNLTAPDDDEPYSARNMTSNRNRTPKTRNDALNRSAYNRNSNIKNDSQRMSNKSSYTPMRPSTATAMRRSMTTAEEQRRRFIDNKVQNDLRGPEEVQELKEAFEAKNKRYNPSTKNTRVTGADGSYRTPKGTGRGNSNPSGSSSPNNARAASASSKKDNSPSPQARHITPSAYHKREYSVKQQTSGFTRYVSPRRENSISTTQVAKKLEFSVGPSTLGQKSGGSKGPSLNNIPDKKRASSPVSSRPSHNGKDGKGSQVNTSQSSIQNIPSSGQTKKKKKQKTAQEEKNKPVQVTLSLSKKSMRPNMTELEEKMKKVWPVGLGIVKPSVIKVESTMAPQLSAQILSPQYYRVKLSKDPSVLEIQTVKPVPSKKANKSSSTRLKDLTLQEIDTISLVNPHFSNTASTRSINVEFLNTSKVA